jgi:hypothetical protein
VSIAENLHTRIGTATAQTPGEPDDSIPWQRNSRLQVHLS